MKVTITIPDDAVEAVHAAANEAGLKPSEWARSTLVKSARSAERARARTREASGT